MYGNKKHITGAIGEKIACLWLMAKGHTILACNEKGLAEVDILARKHNVITIIEVKTRLNTLYTHAAIRPAQRRRLQCQLTALAGKYPEYTLQCDAVFIQPRWPFIEHVENIL